MFVFKIESSYKVRRQLRVGMAIIDPWLNKKMDKKGKIAKSPDGVTLYEGFCLDFLEKLSEYANFDYQIVIQGERVPGMFAKNFNKYLWNLSKKLGESVPHYQNFLINQVSNWRGIWKKFLDKLVELSWICMDVWVDGWIRVKLGLCRGLNQTFDFSCSYKFDYEIQTI